MGELPMISDEMRPFDYEPDTEDIICDNCGAQVAVAIDSPVTHLDDCEFCRRESTCCGHFRWVDPLLQKEIAMDACSETATVHDTQSGESYCERGWKILVEGDEEQAEEFCIRLDPEDTSG